MNQFPIDSIKDQIIASVNSHDFIILKSSPGSGKTTRVPVFLDEVLNKKIYILEPRRLAAKLASHYVAKAYQQIPGQKVGHIFKYEKMISPESKIIFVTEGTFLRLITDEKTIAETDLVILDEFHERHLFTDMALSFLLELKKKNPHLKIMIMSATIETKKFEEIFSGLGPLDIITLDQRKYDLEIQYLENNTLILKDPLERKVLNAVKENLNRDGHILVFLPGMSEINKCQTMLQNIPDIEIIPIHGELKGLEIDDSYSNLKLKKVLLSTNIAESSVTIPGVRTVIDSGLHRTTVLHHLTRIPSIELKKISRSSAIQRAHRSNREDHGLAIRLYPKLDYEQRPEYDLPEILRCDLADFVFKSETILNTSAEQLRLIDPIPEIEFKNTYEYLIGIDFLDDQLKLKTDEIINQSPYSPRVSKILFEATKYSKTTFEAVLDYLANWLEPMNPKHFKDQARSYFKIKDHHPDGDIEKVFLTAFIDQISKTKDGKSYELLHQNGINFKINEDCSEHFDPKHFLYLIIDTNNRNEVTHFLPIEEEWLYDLPRFPISELNQYDFNLEKMTLRKETLTKIKAITLDQQTSPVTYLNQEDKDFMLSKLLPIIKNLFQENRFRRFQFFKDKKLENFDLDSFILKQLDHFQSGDTDFISNLISPLEYALIEYFEIKTDVEDILPLFLKLHDKRKLEINYDITNGVSVEGFIQDFYGLSQVPRILGGEIPLTIHLLGPHKRALQVTKDLNSFWDKAYKEMHNELKRDYPKHYWPDNPRVAKPFLLLRHVQ